MRATARFAMVRSRWSLNFVNNLTILDISSTGLADPAAKELDLVSPSTAGKFSPGARDLYCILSLFPALAREAAPVIRPPFIPVRK
jgi:hypothetical protein